MPGPSSSIAMINSLAVEDKESMTLEFHEWLNIKEVNVDVK